MDGAGMLPEQPARRPPPWHARPHSSPPLSRPWPLPAKWPRHRPDPCGPRDLPVELGGILPRLNARLHNVRPFRRRAGRHRLVTPREQLLLIWDLISPQGQEAVMAAARQAGRAEGLDLACGMAIVVPFKISFMQPTQHDVHALERGIAEEMTRRGPELRTGKN
jgi:hypothetical protein